MAQEASNQKPLGAYWRKVCTEKKKDWNSHKDVSAVQRNHSPVVKTGGHKWLKHGCAGSISISEVGTRGGGLQT